MIRNKQYEKGATKTSDDVYKQMKLSFSSIGMMCGIFAGWGASPWIRIFGIFLGAFLGYCGGLICISRLKKPMKKIIEIERTEGYTDNIMTEAYNLLAKKNNVNTKTLIAGLHNFRGEFQQTLNVLNNVNESEFTFSPHNAELYYSQLMLAYLMTGNLDKAADTYNRGAYFMHTYMNSPMSGCYISTALAVYEYYAGRLDNALNFIVASDNAAICGYKPEEKIPQNCMWTVNCYWRALFLACKGMKNEALDVLNNTNGIYTTDYYKMAIEKLRNDIAAKNS